MLLYWLELYTLDHIAPKCILYIVFWGKKTLTTIRGLPLSILTFYLFVYFLSSSSFAKCVVQLRACGSCRKIISQQNECKKKNTKLAWRLITYIPGGWLCSSLLRCQTNKKLFFSAVVLSFRAAYDIYCRFTCAYMIFRCIIYVIFFLRRQPDSSLIRPLLVQGQRSQRHYTYCLNRSCSAPYIYRYMYNNIINYNTARSGGGACAHV